MPDAGANRTDLFPEAASGQARQPLSDFRIGALISAAGSMASTSLTKDEPGSGGAKT